jgi:hypothetical protein
MSQAAKYPSPAARQAAYRLRKAQSEARKAEQTGLVPLPAISSIPGTVRWRQALAYAASYVRTTYEEMSDYHDERTEYWQESERASEFLERMEEIDQIAELIEEVRQQIGGV